VRPPSRHPCLSYVYLPDGCHRIADLLSVTTALPSRLGLGNCGRPESNRHLQTGKVGVLSLDHARQVKDP